ncbi:MAG: NlpC/P60 family protein [Defluviitaleaceae bacterium]|nr:NlpC/P60 family protein [Defluviitaleaceae bacterium]
MHRAVFFCLLFTIFSASAVYASSDTHAVVIGSRVNVRQYAEISDNVLFQVDRGTAIEIRGVSGDFFIAEIAGENDVYIARDFVLVTQTKGVITAPFALVYDIQADATTAFSTLRQGDAVTVLYEHEGFFGILFGDTVAFVEQNAISIPCFADLPISRVGPRLANIIIETAFTYIGTPYLWGGETPAGFDCSGFMVYLFTAHGINLERSSAGQSRHNGIVVARNELERGDLVFFGSGSHVNHVGLYIGNGQFIHSSSDLAGGVRICGMYEPHNASGFVMARRVIGF